MLTPVYTKHFEKDLKLMLRRGKDVEKIKTVIVALAGQRQLPVNLRDHILTGNFKSRRECHIEPDWLLVYRIDSESIIFERTGTLL